MKILLVSPRNPESFWTLDRILPSLGKRCVFPNLALPTVAALTPHEFDVTLADENIEDIDYETDAEIVGITGYVVHAKRIAEIAAEFRRRGRLVAIGGPYATLCPEEVRAHADVLFVGEAEYTWPRFLRDYREGVWEREYVQVEKPSMEDSPLPRFELLRHEAYRTMTIQFARGCPFQCEFCDIIVMYGRVPRAKAVSQVLAEVEAVHRLGIRNVFVVDDNFIGNKPRAKELLAALAAWQREHGYPIEFMTEVSLNAAQDDELLRLFREAKFGSVFVGIESPRAASLQESRKTQNLRADLVKSVHRMQDAGIEVMAGMIVGFDHDDLEIFEEQFRFLEESRIPISMTGMLNAVPKTPLHERLRVAGRLDADSVGDQFVFTNVVPLGMSRSQLYEGYRRLLERLYSYRNYRRRVMSLVLARGGRVAEGVAMTRADAAIFGRVLWHCVLAASPRRALLTLSMMAEALVRRPAALRDVVVFALLHKHFYEYMRDTSGRLARLAAELRERESSVDNLPRRGESCIA